jgi:alpha-tubulin suppressor-like RCC1 family protein
VGHGNAVTKYLEPALAAAMAGIRVRSVVAGTHHSLALSWDGRVYLWGWNGCRQLGHGDEVNRLSPVLIEGLQGVHIVAAARGRSFAVTQSGDVFSLSRSFQSGCDPRPTIVQGFGGVRVRHVSARCGIAFAIGEAGELFSLGYGQDANLGHGDLQPQPSPKRVEALRGVRVSSVSSCYHAMALTEDGQV